QFGLSEGTSQESLTVTVLCDGELSDGKCINAEIGDGFGGFDNGQYKCDHPKLRRCRNVGNDEQDRQPCTNRGSPQGDPGNRVDDRRMTNRLGYGREHFSVAPCQLS